MGVLLQAFYQRGNAGVPSPADGDPIDPWWDHIAKQANAFRKAGFTAIWLPPVTKGGSGKDSVGYDVFDDYDIGSRNQKGTVATHYGTREQLVRCVAILRANGIDVYADLVENQRGGGNGPGGFTFRYPGANGQGQGGRFPKDPIDFHPNVPQDPNVPGPDFSFGADLAAINGGKPKGQVAIDLQNSADWLTRSLGIQGYRLDDVKGQSTDFLRPFLNTKSMGGKFAVAEFFDGNVGLVQDWLFRQMGGRASAFDFSTRFTLQAMCDNRPFNMATLDHTGLVGQSPLQAVTFVENHDTDRTSPIFQNKMLAYAYILTSEGYPSVFYKDYSTDQFCFGLKPNIDNLIFIHEQIADGVTLQRFKDLDVFAYERMSGAHLLVGLNNNPETSRTITVFTGFGPNATLHDYTGHAGDVRTDGAGQVTITIPRNVNGLSYICYSRLGIGADFKVETQAVTQDLEGAADLDILPALSGTAVQAGRIWCAAESQVRAGLKPVNTDWTGDTSINVQLLGPDGGILAQQAFHADTPADTVVEAATQAEGFHTLRLTSANTPEANPNPPYTLSVKYTAPQTLGTGIGGKSVAAATGAENAAQIGQWTAVIPLANVPIHTHVLPTGKVLFWGRRKTPGDQAFPSLNERETHAFIWDPANPDAVGEPTGNKPTNKVGQTINLFCSGHTFNADGHLVVTGGHIFDSQGISESTFYDPFKDRWSPGPDMGIGRWYPTAVTLPDGRVFVVSGSHATGVPAAPPNNFNTLTNIPQVLDNGQNGQWLNTTDFDGLPLFPRIHVAPNGFLFMSGPLAESYYLENLLPQNANAWVPLAARGATFRDYAPSVMYNVGKVIFIGGGLDPVTNTPTNIAEVIDLNAVNPTWTTTNPMHFARRQHNATILPDGTVFVNGGTRGVGFDDLDNKTPVHTPELWDSATGSWTIMADEAVDRCYHSTSVLLPDGRVFSAGGGEYAPQPAVQQSNPPGATHANCQIFSPPYLFKGPGPVITKAPPTVSYGADFEIETPAPNEIGQVTWIRLPSVTHSFDQNQRLNFLRFVSGVQSITVTAPLNPNVCPPGHYMLFLLNKNKVPSVASIIQITAATGASVAPAAAAVSAAAIPSAPIVFKSLAEKLPGPIEKDTKIRASEPNPPIIVGITPTCPYGLSACWAGAYEALQHLSGVRVVLPVPNPKDSTGFVYINEAGLPNIEAWPKEFASSANGVHRFRGVEITVAGTIKAEPGGMIVIQADDTRSVVLLQPILAADKIQWDVAAAAPQPITQPEQEAYASLQDKVNKSGGTLNATVTGPFKHGDRGYVLEVRVFQENAQKI